MSRGTPWGSIFWKEIINVVFGPSSKQNRPYGKNFRQARQNWIEPHQRFTQPELCFRKVSSINFGVWANNLRRFDKIVLAGFLKLHLRVQKSIVRTFYVWKELFFCPFWTLTKTKSALWQTFFRNCCENCIQQDHRSFLRRSFLKKKPFSSISDNERNSFGLLGKSYQQVVRTAPYASRETFSVHSFSWDFELSTISRCWTKNVPPCGRKISAGLSKL